MNVYLYYQKLQVGMMERIKAQLKSVYEFENLYSINEAVFDKSPNYLVVISQPDQLTLRGLVHLQWDSVIVYSGVRWEGDNNTEYFSDENDLVMILKKTDDRFHQGLKKKYVDRLCENREINDEDVEYLESLNVKEIKSKKRSTKEQSKGIKWKGLIGIVGNSEWAASFAITVADTTKQSVLIVDGNLIAPSLDCYYGINEIQTSIESHIRGIDNSGLNIALDAIGKRASLEQNIEKLIHKIGNTAYVMLGNYNIYNYEHYDETQLELLLAQLQKYFDIVIVNVPNTIYDSMCMLTLHLSHVNVFVMNDQAESVRYHSNILEALTLKQKITKNKNLMIKINEQSKPAQFAESTMKMLFGSMYVGSSNLRRSFFRKNPLQLAIINKIMTEKRRWG